MSKKTLLYYNDLEFSPSRQFLEKDFGQVPLTISKLYDFELEYLIVTNKPDYSFTEFDGRKVIQIKKHFQSLPNSIDFLKNISLYLYLLRRINRYSHLIFFPFVPISDFFFLILFKFFNPKCSTYVKLDANLNFINSLLSDYKKNSGYFSSLFKIFFYYKLILKNADLISYETHDVGSVLNSNFLGIDNLHTKSINIYNGISENLIMNLNINRKTFSQKENIVLIVGRHGIWEKNTELVFEATRNIKTDWKFIFLGPIEPSFNITIDIYRDI